LTPTNKQSQEQMELKKNRVLVEYINKNSLLASKEERKYDYEEYKFKVVEISPNVIDRTLVGKTILKQKNLGIPLPLEGKEYLVITEDDILATL